MVAVACWLLLTGDGCVMRVPSAGRACGVEEKKEPNSVPVFESRIQLAVGPRRSELES